MVKPYCLTLIALLAATFPLRGHVSVRGTVSDRGGEGVFAATVCLKPSLACVTVTDLDGHFAMEVPPHALRDTLIVSFIGYHTERFLLPDTKTVPGDTLFCRITLREDSHLLSSVVVEDNREITEEFSLEKLSQTDIWLSPVAAGDPLNAISFLPASTGTDESANPTFRGSRSTSSHVLLNGIPVANPVRNTQLNGMGNFSLFNNALIEDLTVYAGNPPLSKSSAVAGTADLTTTRRLTRSQTQCSLSLANIGVMRSQVLGHDSTGGNFLQAYSNWQFPQPYIALNHASDQISSFRTNDLGVNLHLVHPVDKQLSGNFYGYFIDECFEGGAYQYSRYEGSAADNRRWLGIGNLRYAFRQWVFSLNGGLDFQDGSIESGRSGGHETARRLNANASAKCFVSDRFYAEGGLALGFLKSDLESHRPADLYDPGDEPALTRVDTTLKSLNPEIFLYARYEPADGWTAGAGLRWSLAGSADLNPAAVHPVRDVLSWQANLKRCFNRRHTVLLSVGQYHDLSSPGLNDASIAPMSSFQASAEYGFHEDECKIEGAVYYKEESGPDILTYSGECIFDERVVLGAEVSALRDFGRLRTSLSFTTMLAYTRYDGDLFLSDSHVPWSFKGLVQYATERQLTVALSGQARAGTRYTPVTGGVADESGAGYRPVFGAVNSAANSAYIRFDLTVNKVLYFEKGVQAVFFATLTNLFNRPNEAGPVYTYDYSAQAAAYTLQPYAIYFGLQLQF